MARQCHQRDAGAEPPKRSGPVCNVQRQRRMPDKLRLCVSSTDRQVDVPRRKGSLVCISITLSLPPGVTTFAYFRFSYLPAELHLLAGITPAICVHLTSLFEPPNPCISQVSELFS